MKLFLAIAALCIGATVATEVSHEDQVRHEEMLAELCKETGIFPNPHDPEGRTFIRCELEPVELRCDDGFIFDAEKLMCVEEPKPEPIPVDMDKVDWMAVLKCPNFEDKYYRNPYDCHRFYRCYQEGHFQRIGLGQCVPSMIFDDVLETCLPAEQFKSYYGHGCEARALPDEFKPGHENHGHDETHHNEGDNENTHSGDHDHKEGEHHNENSDNHNGETDHSHTGDDGHENPDNHNGETDHSHTDEHGHEEPHHNEGDNENTHSGDHEHENPDNHNGETDHSHSGEHGHEDTQHHEGEHEHEQEKEPEKVPSLKDILKEIQEMFNKKH